MSRAPLPRSDSTDEKDALVPDITRWRRERVPTLPTRPYCTSTPDWTCEANLVDPIRAMLEVYTPEQSGR